MSKEFEGKVRQRLRIVEAAGIDRAAVAGAMDQKLREELERKGFDVKGKSFDEIEQLVTVPEPRPAKPPSQDGLTLSDGTKASISPDFNEKYEAHERGLSRGNRDKKS